MSRRLLLPLGASIVSLLLVAAGVLFRSDSDPAEVEPEPSAVPASVRYPADVLDLENWKLTLPVDSPRDDDDNAGEVRQPCLARACYDPSRDLYADSAYRLPYSDEFFYLNRRRDGVVFRAPVAGITTSGSDNVRSELRELAPAGPDGEEVEARWSNRGPAVHTMVVSQSINATPEGYPSVVSAQIHDEDDDVVLIKLRGTRLFVDADDGDFEETLDEHYELGTRFTLKLVATNGEVRVTYNDQKPVVYRTESDSMYFKAGVYNQSNLKKYPEENPYSFGEVVIYDLKVSHVGAPAAPPGGDDDDNDD